MRLRHFDLFCCEGGGSEGLRRAGFDVYGVDLFKHEDGVTATGKPKVVGFSQKRYPFPSVHMDALTALSALLLGEALLFDNGERLGLRDFASMSASPPCQHASAGTRTMRARGTSKHPALIEPTRLLLQQTGLPWFIENVKGAALIDPIVLCGSMFGLATEDEDGLPLRLERHRLFESNVPLTAPGPCQHDAGVQVAGVYGGGRGRKPGQSAAQHRIDCREDRGGGYVPAALEVQQRLLGIDWMTKAGMAQSLPPVYTQHLGLQLMAHVVASTDPGPTPIDVRVTAPAAATDR